jgi:hypothetical protein
MKKEEIKEITNEYFKKSKPDWVDNDQEYDTKTGFRMGFAYALEHTAQQAISSHEAGKWKKYPENVPEIIETEYIVTACQDVVFIAYFDDGWLVNGIDISEKVIAFRELAAPYQEGGDNG